MPIARIYQEGSLSPQGRFRLTDEASHHVARVLRARLGDQLTLFNGQGGEYTATITAIDKKNVEVEMLAFTDRQAESPLDIYLAQGIARGEKMDFIMQKAVELGVNHIIPLITERCNVKLDPHREEKRIQHWQSVVISACEQSGRNNIPIVLSPQTLKEWLTQIKADICLVLSPHTQAKLPVQSITSTSRIVLLIGPEGGLSSEEIEMAMQHGFHPWHLGPRVLRTETAALAAISALQYAFGDFR